MNKKILILYTSIGLGHKYIAFNIAFHLERAGFEIRLADVLQVQSGPMVKIGEWFHSLINRRFPFVWRWLYFSKVFSKATMWLRVPLAGRNLGNIKKQIDDFQPDIVIATQTSASAPMAYMKQHKMFNGKFVIAFSDYHFHPYWFYKEADYYLVNIQEQVRDLQKFGVPQDKISVCGITLKPYEPVDPEVVKQKLSVQGKDVVLMSSGSLGIGFSEKLMLSYAEELKKINSNYELVVVCGKNEEMRAHLAGEAIEKQLPMTVLGFYEPMAELYSITKVFLTKPGGLTVAEALRDNVQMLITHILPGQEELNYEYLTSRHLMHPIPDGMSAKILAQVTDKIATGKIRVETSNSEEITQKNKEGAILIESIKKLFHDV